MTAGFTAELLAAEDPVIGDEVIVVRFDDGTFKELRLHDYEQLYALPGVYEAIVHDRLGCRSPAQMAGMLAAAVDQLGWLRGDTRVLDIAAGNGVSGEALVAEGLHPVIGSDIVPTAREAALRDRPKVYDDYLTLDLTALSESERDALVAARANVLSCVAVVGEQPAMLPLAAFAVAAAALTPDALVSYMHDPAYGEDVVTAGWWSDVVGPDGSAVELERRRYLHRFTLNGGRFELEGVVWRLRRGRESGQAQ